MDNVVIDTNSLIMAISSRNAYHKIWQSFHSITDADIKAGSGNEVQLGVTYNISVYATKSGYDNSETATATLCWIDASPKTEGITNGIANISANVS